MQTPCTAKTPTGREVLVQATASVIAWWNLGIYCSCVDHRDSQGCQNCVTSSNPYLQWDCDGSISKGHLRIKWRNRAISMQLLLSPWKSQLAFLGHCMQFKMIQLDDYISGSWNILCQAPWIYLDLGWSVALRHKEVWDPADCWAPAAWVNTSCQDVLWWVAGVFAPLAGFNITVPILFPRVWERASGCGDPQAGFLPRASGWWNSQSPGEISCFVFHKPQWLLITKSYTLQMLHTIHTHTDIHTSHACTHTHQNKKRIHKTDVLSPPFARVQGLCLASVLASFHASAFPLSWRCC